MRLKSSKDAESLHEKNCAEIRRLIEIFKDPNTPEDERAKIKERFEKILEHADNISPNSTIFTKMNDIKNNGNGHRTNGSK